MQRSHDAVERTGAGDNVIRERSCVSALLNTLLSCFQRVEGGGGVKQPRHFVHFKLSSRATAPFPSSCWLSQPLCANSAPSCGPGLSLPWLTSSLSRYVTLMESSQPPTNRTCKWTHSVASWDPVLLCKNTGLADLYETTNKACADQPWSQRWIKDTFCRLAPLPGWRALREQVETLFKGTLSAALRVHSCRLTFWVTWRPPLTQQATLQSLDSSEVNLQHPL